jgi:hypothetical protein
MQVGGKCVTGHKPTGDPITVKLLRSDGSVRATRTDDTTELEWRVCFPVAVMGSRVRLTHFGATRTVRIPNLTAAANRVNNLVNGRAPAGGQVSIKYHSCHPGECVPWASRLATANDDGRYRKDLSTGSTPADIDGSDKIDVSYQNNQGDSFTRTTYAPYMEIQAPNTVRVRCQPEGTTVVKLRTSGGAVRATKSFTFDKACDAASGTFRKSGSPVNLIVGNRVTADFASDASLTWPAMAVSGQLGGHQLSGHCTPDSYFMVRMSAGTVKTFIATTDANGDFLVDTTSHWTFQGGDRLDLVCETTRGDRVRRVRVLSSVPD